MAGDHRTKSALLRRYDKNGGNPPLLMRTFDRITSGFDRVLKRMDKFQGKTNFNDISVHTLQIAAFKFSYVVTCLQKSFI